MVIDVNVAVFGATGGIGIELVGQALGLGHSVTAFVRDPAPLADRGDGLTIVTGDVRAPADVARAVRGQEAVLCALGASDLKKTTIRATGTANIIRAMEHEGVRRLIVVSAMGIGTSWTSLSLFNRLFLATVLRSARADHQAQEAAVTASGLDWTIVRPSGLVNAPGTGVYDVGENVRATTSRIPRADVAHLILNELETGALIHKAVTITT